MPSFSLRPNQIVRKWRRKLVPRKLNELIEEWFLNWIMMNRFSAAEIARRELWGWLWQCSEMWSVFVLSAENIWYPPPTTDERTRLVGCPFHLSWPNKTKSSASCLSKDWKRKLLLLLCCHFHPAMPNRDQNKNDFLENGCNCFRRTHSFWHPLQCPSVRIRGIRLAAVWADWADITPHFLGPLLRALKARLEA